MALRELKVKNFAIVEDGALNFEECMTAFTGETGAGKSLLLDAITLLLGAKARSDLVRTGAKSAEVEGVFDISRDPEKCFLAETLGFGLEADETALFVRREISAQEPSRNRIWIQGRSATRAQLQALLGDWVEVSGQHEFLRLGRDDYILAVVDQFGGLREDARDFARRYVEVQELEKRYLAYRESEAHRESRLDYLKFQIEEFEKAGIGPESESEEAKLMALRARLGSVEKIRLAYAQARDLLDGAESSENGGKSEGVLNAVQILLRELRPFADFGEDFAQSLKLSEEVAGQLHEVSRGVNRILDSVEADPNELERAELRLSHINRLKRKYNCDVAALVEVLTAARLEMDLLGKSESTLQELEKQWQKQSDLLREMAAKLHLRRAEAGEALQSLWQKDIRQLGMGKARLELSIETKSQMHESGFSRIEALFSANPGEPPKPLGKIASGGELSRIMLALKNIVAGRSEVAVYLFDEVDAGIGGETAQAVGQRLRTLACDNQVLVVTHLAQIAAKAHCQYKIEKITEKGRTRTLVTCVEAKDRHRELARMLGDPASRAAQTLARELLRRADEGLALS